MRQYTPEDLLLYLYKETDVETTSSIENALASDWTLREKLSVLQASMNRLSQITASPRTEVILKVLKYGALKEKASR